LAKSQYVWRGAGPDRTRFAGVDREFDWIRISHGFAGKKCSRLLMTAVPSVHAIYVEHLARSSVDIAKGCDDNAARPAPARSYFGDCRMTP
jgi:hypothetical protein